MIYFLWPHDFFCDSVTSQKNSSFPADSGTTLPSSASGNKFYRGIFLFYHFLLSRRLSEQSCITNHLCPFCISPGVTFVEGRYPSRLVITKYVDGKRDNKSNYRYHLNVNTFCTHTPCQLLFLTFYTKVYYLIISIILLNQ